MDRRTFLLSASACLGARAAGMEPILDPETFAQHVTFFNEMVPEDAVQYVPNAQAWEFLKRNIPFFTCPDAEIERLYYYRWWVFRKHIEQTPEGFVITEFLKKVPHAGEYNALSCALGHHIAEGRWLRDGQFIDADIKYWLKPAKNLHQFSGWVADAVWQRGLANGATAWMVGYLDALVADYQAWVAEKMTASGLFWQRDVSDGMEESASGGRKVKNIRPSINSYMYGNARAIAAIAKLAGKRELAAEYAGKAEELRQLTLEKLWSADAAFFETRNEAGEFVPVRENIGYTPWYFDLPTEGRGYEVAWKQLSDPQGFGAPYGPTTAERRSPLFKLVYEGDDCQWNGPAWPFATTITLKALANVLNDYKQSVVGKEDYFALFETYTKSQHIKLDDGRVIPWVDENQNPLTGEWIARAMKIRKKSFYGRGDHYNHSGYCDPLVTGLVGLRPRGDEVVEVNPLVPEGRWDWFCLDRVPYHGREVSVVWDKTGKKFGRDKGLAVFVNGKEVARSARLARVTGGLV